MAKCKECGRNYMGKMRGGRCPICAEMNYRYSQGAITLEAYKKWEKDWIKKYCG